jgi:glycosyltransferase involved in cell wall biosynthesis
MGFRMNIAIVTNSFGSVSGISTYVRNVAANSRMNGSTPIIVSADDVTAPDEPGYESVHATSKLFIILKTITVLLKHDVTRVQCHGRLHMLLACVIYKYLRYLRDIKVVSVKHSDIAIPSKFKRKFLQFLDNRTDGIVFVSDYLRDKYKNGMDFQHRVPTHVVHPGCGVAVYRQTVIDELASVLHVSCRHPLLSYISLLHYPGKVAGLLMLLEALQKLTNKYPQILLAIAGRGPLKGAVVEKIAALGLQEHVHILEGIDKPYELLQLADLHCHISLQDSFGIVVLEALSTATPVVASATGEMNRMSLEGLVLVDTTPEAIARAISRVLEKPPVVDLATLRERYDWQHQAADLNRFTLSPS